MRITTKNSTEDMPVWSPDSQSLVYVEWDEKDGGSIYKYSLKGRKKFKN